MPRLRKRLTLVLRLAAIGSIGCAAMAQQAKSADLLLVSEVLVTGLRQHVQAWEQNTGHRINWRSSASIDEESSLADVLIIPAHQFSKEEKRLRPLFAPEKEEGDALAPLLSGPWQVVGGGDEISWLALPLPTQLPLVHVDPKQAFARKGEFPAALSWPELMLLAYEMADSVNDVHGLCIDPAYPHARVVRSMLADAGLPWLEDGQPYASEGWEEMAQLYARMLAASSPPNAADMDSSTFAKLRDEGKCALYLTAWKPGQEFAGKLMAVPGASAFVSDKMPLVAVDIDSKQVSLASNFAWSLVTADAAVQSGSIGVRHDSNTSIAARAWPAVQSMLRQAGRTEYLQGGWEAADAAGQGALQALVDGLQPVEQVLAAARESQADR